MFKQYLRAFENNFLSAYTTSRAIHFLFCMILMEMHLKIIFIIV